MSVEVNCLFLSIDIDAGGTALRVAPLFHNFCYINMSLLYCTTLSSLLFFWILLRDHCKVQAHCVFLPAAIIRCYIKGI